MNRDDDLPEDWEQLDSHNGFFLYIEHCREEQRQGKPLPAMFQPCVKEDGEE